MLMCHLGRVNAAFVDAPATLPYIKPKYTGCHQSAFVSAVNAVKWRALSHNLIYKSREIKSRDVKKSLPGSQIDLKCPPGLSALNKIEFYFNWMTRCQPPKKPQMPLGKQQAAAVQQGAEAEGFLTLTS